VEEYFAILFAKVTLSLLILSEAIRTLSSNWPKVKPKTDSNLSATSFPKVLEIYYCIPPDKSISLKVAKSS
jgi:hypothetical protein